MAVTLYEKIKAMTIIEMASFLSETYHHTDYEEDDYDPEIMQMLKSPLEEGEKGMNLNELAKEIHQNAVDHGWWKEDRHFGSLVALMHSELSEALEEYRNGHAPNEIYYICNQNPAIKERCSFEEAEIESDCCPYAEISHGECEYRDRKPEGIPIELADCIIRILDYCGKEGIDIEEAIRKKHEYNKTRSYRHGGKQI